MSLDEFEHKVPNSELGQIVNSVSAIIDKHLQWYRNLDHVTQSFITYPFYSRTRDAGGTKLRQAFESDTQNPFEKMIFNEFGQIEDNMQDLTHDQRMIVFNRLKQAYNQTGWHAYFKAINNSGWIYILIITDTNSKPNFEASFTVFGR